VLHDLLEQLVQLLELAVLVNLLPLLKAQEDISFSK
jgi:hypothetical protein